MELISIDTILIFDNKIESILINIILKNMSQRHKENDRGI